MTSYRLEEMRNDPANRRWGGNIYFCKTDPRTTVRKRIGWIGWTWNFGNPWTIPETIMELSVMFAGIWVTGKINATLQAWSFFALIVTYLWWLDWRSSPDQFCDK